MTHRASLASALPRFALLLAVIAPAAAAPPPREVARLEGWLSLGTVAGGGRSVLRTDPVEYRIVVGTWTAPRAGDTVTRADGKTRDWKPATPGDDGWIDDEGLTGGYVFATAHVDAPTIAILDAAGHSMVYVNGEPRMGDPYAYGYLRLPVELKAGENTFLFRVDRGRVRARLVEPTAPVFLNVDDPTLPDQVEGENEKLLGAVVVVNATREPIPAGKYKIRSSFGDGTADIAVPSILPLTIRKVPINIAAQPDWPSGEAPLKLELLNAAAGDVVDKAELQLRVAAKDDWRRVTFTSDIDGSVQYYAMWPPAPGGDANKLPGLIFTVHGASVEATNQVKAYKPKTWAYIVAPTNRRPYGFDWEDWGRLDALEVWDHFIAHHKTDPSRRWLTGHSMGGHGTWQLGAHFPDRFAAIAPCSGWVSFFSYVEKEGVPVAGESKIAELLRRATNPSNTLALAQNYKHFGVYVLHGDADDNVPVTEARTMREALGKFHADFCYYEKPGGGHWWDNSAVDWPPLMDFLRARTLKPTSELREIDFTTVNPAISPSSRWVSIVEQDKVLAPSRVQIRFDPATRHFTATTENVAALVISTSPPTLGAEPRGVLLAPAADATIEIDGQSLDIPASARERFGVIELRRSDGRWQPCQVGQDEDCESELRRHAFKAAFASHMRFVYGTAGTADENAWSLAKARYDAEQWYYRGNGAVDVIADRAFDVLKHSGFGCVAYGNASTNLVVRPLLSDSHVTADNGAASVGDHRLSGDNLATLILHERGGAAPIAVIAPTGPVGMRLCDRLPYFTSGIAYPDVTVLSPDVLVEGLPGVLATGYLGNDGTVEHGEFGWGE